MKRAAGCLFLINLITLLLALVGLGYSIFLVATEGSLCLEGCLSVPTIWGWSAFGLTICVSFVSLLAIIAVYKHIKAILIFMSFFTFITFAASVALTVIISMWTSQTGLGGLSGPVYQLESQFKIFLAGWAMTHPVDWIGLQSSLQCCGVGLEACYEFSTTWKSYLHTGPSCTAALDARIDSHMYLNPEYVLSQDVSLNAILRAENNGADYFCENRFKDLAKEATLYVAIVLGFLSLFQLLAFVLSNYLICCVKKDDGGFAEIDFETGEIEKPMVAFVNNAKEITQESKQFANRVSTRVGLNLAHGANRVSMQFGFQPPINEERFKPPPGMPPPGLGRGGGPPPSGPPPGIHQVDIESSGKSAADFGPEYAKYERMKKSGLPSGAVRNAMQRDGVAVPPGFLDESEETSAAAAPAVRKPAPPPVQAVKNFANRVSSRMQKTTNRMSVNVKGMFAPPPPPPGFGGLPAESAAPPPGFGYQESPASAMESGFGGATMNPAFKAGNSAPIQEFAPIQAPPPPSSKKTAPAPAPAKKAAPAPKKAAPAPKKAAAAPAKPAAGGGGGAPGFLADIGGGGGFALKKTVTNDRSGPNLNLKG